MLTRDFVLAFREAAPYINAFRGKTFILGISGEAISKGYFRSLAQDISLLITLGVRIVLVHGIYPQYETVTKQRVAKAQPRLAVADLATLEAMMQSIGLVRHHIEAMLSMSMPNSPMHGARLRIAGGNMLTAQPIGVINGIDMLYTGQIRRVDAQAIESRLQANELVLLSPIGYSPTGEAFSLKMEEVATTTAIVLKAEKLIFFLLDDAGPLFLNATYGSALTAQQAETLLKQGNLTEDVAHYLPYLIKASRHEVPRAHLVSCKEDGALLAELFTNGGIGSMIARDPLVKVRHATLEDIGDILSLIRPLEEQGILVKRSRELLEIEIAHYFVLEDNHRIHGCIALQPFLEASMAELACLVIRPEQRNARFGEMLLNHVEHKARQLGLTSLFVLTTQTAHWFIERGFVEGKIDDLPLTRQQFYNYQRRSKVFVKKL